MFSAVDCKHNPVGPPPGVDTTSNNFTFQTFTFGAANAGSSYLQDVAVINDTDAWAVGAIYLDSADGAPDPFPYNAVHWDGQKWTPEQIRMPFRGNTIMPPLYGVFAFSPSQVWLCGDLAVFGDGTKWTTYDVRLLTGYDSLFVTKCWGSGPSDMYFCGMTGSLVHYTSGAWTKIATGTDLYFTDIYGSGGQIIAVGIEYSDYTGGVFRVQGNTATQIPVNPIQYALYSVWFISDQHYYVADGNLYEKHSLSDTAWIPLDITGAATTGVRANALNDVFVVSATGDFLHWNGKVWKSFRAETGLQGGSYARVATKGNLAVAVGENNPVAVITMARRQ